MSKLKIICSLWVFLVFIWPAAAQTNYSKSTEFPALRVSISDLQAVLAKANSLISASNVSNKAPPWREEIEVRNGELKIKVSGHQLEVVGAKLPKVIDTFEFNFSVRDGVIEGVGISFRDFSRTLTVSGNSPDQVDAVFSALRDDIQKLSTPFGGSQLKSVLGIILFTILGNALLYLTLSYFQEKQKIYLLPISIVVGLAVMLFVLPWSEMLAGFIAVSGDASFMVMYGAQISFWGFVVGLIALPVSIIPLLIGGKK